MSERTLDAAGHQMLRAAAEQGIETAWDRLEKQKPQCGFGELGLCCRHCAQGPCRIDPFGEGPQRGVCGATADTMVARGLLRAIAAGTASHSGHAKHLAHVLAKVVTGAVGDYQVKDRTKLEAVAKRLGLGTSDRNPGELLAAVVEAAFAEFSEREKPLTWVTSTLNPERLDTFGKLGVLPHGVDSAVAEVMHRTTMGVDADPINLLVGGLKCALADYAGCHMATDLSDILFGTPGPVVTEANMGVLKENAVNVALHGHNPVLSDLMVTAANELQAEARAAGAEEGINLVGICCTGNEVLMRHGVPPLTHTVSQELPILTGVLDAVVVDYQCIYPSLVQVAECYGTKIITTMGIAKIPGAVHLELEEERALERAREILRLAIDAFRARRGRPVNIPQVKAKVVAGFSTEAIVAALGKLNADPLKPLLDSFASGNIQGVVLFAGCANVKVPQDRNFLTIAQELLKRDVLVLATGCGAGAFARHGLLDPAATGHYAGPGLKAVLSAVGEANGLGGPLPPVLHMGSCVDNSRAVDLAVALAGRLGVDLDKLPVVASASEYTTEKAVAIGTWAVALGLPVHLGVVPPVLGSKAVAEALTSGVRDLVGGYFLVETDPAKAAARIYEVIQERRAALGLATRAYAEVG